MIGIYKITSPTNKIYIGQSVDINKRFKQHKKMSGGIKNMTRLFNSFRKYGPENHKFEIIEICNVDELNNRERYWQDFYNVIGVNGLNSRLTTSKDKSGYDSLETRLKRSKSLMGHKHSEETKKKLSKPKTKEHIEKIRIIQKNKCKSIIKRQSESLKKNIENSNRLKEFNKVRSKRVICYDRITNEVIGEYESIREASRKTNVDRKCISLSISGKYKYSKNKYFEYV